MSEEAVRLDDVTEPGRLPSGLDMSRICYWKGPGHWWIYLPGGGIGELVNHQVEEHEDGTITVSPSIGLRKGATAGFARHGYLRRGRWEPCGDDQPFSSGSEA